LLLFLVANTLQMLLLLLVSGIVLLIDMPALILFRIKLLCIQNLQVPKVNRFCNYCVGNNTYFTICRHIHNLSIRTYKISYY